DDGPGKDNKNTTIADHGTDGTRTPLTIPAAKAIRWVDAEPLVPAPVASIEALHFAGQAGLEIAGGAAITPPLKQQFTAELWVRHEHANSLGGLLGACALNTATNAPGQGWGLVVRNGSFDLTVATQNNAQTIAAPDTSPALRWTHVAATYDGAKIRLFLDGAEVSSDDVSGDIAYPAEPLLTLGAWQNKSTNP